MKKILMTLMICLILVSMVSAAQERLGRFAVNKDARLIQLCDDCNFNNITSITYPNSSVVVTNVEMTKDGTDYSYTLDSNFITGLGVYNVNGFGDEGGSDTVWAYEFEVTPTGQGLTTAQSMIYIFLLIVIVLVFFGMLACSIMINGENHTSHEGHIVAINYKKYVKMLCVGLTYVSATWITYLGWGISSSVLNVHMMAEIFRMLFTLMMIVGLVAIPAGFIYGVVKFVNEKNIARHLSAGFTGEM